MTPPLFSPLALPPFTFKLANVGKEASAGSKKRKATEKRKGPPNTKCISLKSLVHHQSRNEKSGQKIEKTAQDNSTANVAQRFNISKLDPVSTTSNLTPPPPNPSPDFYGLILLKFCQRIVSKCYGCRALFVNDGYPKESYDFVIVSKTQRSYVDAKTRQKTISSDFSNVYFHFSGSCVLKRDSCFTPQAVAVPEELKKHLSAFHRTFLDSLHIFY